MFISLHILSFKVTMCKVFDIKIHWQNIGYLIKGKYNIVGFIAVMVVILNS